jgi:heme oxygenase
MQPSTNCRDRLPSIAISLQKMRIGLYTLCGALSAAAAFRPAGVALMPVHAPSPVLRAAHGLAMTAATGEVPSFVQTEMRGAAMALHTRDQAPREGKQPAQRPMSSWQPTRADYLQFLVDSRKVYRTLEEIVEETEMFASFRASGLERGAALDKDIAWFAATHGEKEPAVKSQGETYAAELRKMVADGELERFVCHFYNFYFAHTAGGRMIGKRMAGMLLDGHTLEFYQWDGDVDQVLLPGLRTKIDALVAGWSREQKDKCLAETANSFKGGGAMMQHISPPKE